MIKCIDINPNTEARNSKSFDIAQDKLSLVYGELVEPFYHMAKRFIVANWKSNKLQSEAIDWLNYLENFLSEDDKVVVVCPPFTLLSTLKNVTEEKNIPLLLGAQDVSPFETGAYTGEVAATQIKEFADYVIIGHSERRQNFAETDDMLVKKVQRAIAVGLRVIFCVQDKDTLIPEGVEIVAYEPVFAIGSGTPDTPENAEEVARFIKEQRNIPVVLYGGSVTPENIKAFVTQPSINGVLVGGASLESESFLGLIHNA